MTWAETGSKQVAIVGADDKWAFTVMICIANDPADDVVLPLQCIYAGQTEALLPSEDSPGIVEALQLGFLFEVSGTKKYWSNQDRMRTFVDEILQPYFE